MVLPINSGKLGNRVRSLQQLSCVLCSSLFSLLFALKNHPRSLHCQARILSQKSSVVCKANLADFLSYSKATDGTVGIADGYLELNLCKNVSLFASSWSSGWKHL